ncbi:MAG: protein-L-isoaspartate(D-aspartate) O-methyltransferase [Pseudomonadales bacterium]
MAGELNILGVGMTSQRTRTRLVDRLRAQGIASEKILGLISVTPRHAFIDEALAHRAYEDTALPIGYSQTISQPYIVARMTEALCGAAGKVDRVLEIGTGSGYQTAVLAQLADTVYTVERIAPLQARARQILASIGHRNIVFKHDDGNLGWAEQAPFDAIMVTAAPPEVPSALLEQLADGGRMLVPVGDGQTQQLMLFQRQADEVVCESLDLVRFVPLVSGKFKE